MIKYLGSKRALVPALGRMASATGARTAVDLFAGTTRVAQAFKRRGMEVTACDIATYSEVLAACYIETDARAVDTDELAEPALVDGRFQRFHGGMEPAVEDAGERNPIEGKFGLSKTGYGLNQHAC